jgi:hypothetical protein
MVAGDWSLQHPLYMHIRSIDYSRCLEFSALVDINRAESGPSLEFWHLKFTQIASMSLFHCFSSSSPPSADTVPCKNFIQLRVILWNFVAYDTPKFQLGAHPFLAVHDCVFNIFAYLSRLLYLPNEVERDVVTRQTKFRYIYELYLNVALCTYRERIRIRNILRQPPRKTSNLRLGVGGHY